MDIKSPMSRIATDRSPKSSLKRSVKPAKPVQNHGRSARLPMYRIIQIHELLKEGKFPNCQALSDDFEVSYKTVQRDIDFMRDQLQLPIEYDSARRGFIYTKEVNNLPMVALKEGEVVALLVAQKAAEQYRGTPFEKALRSAFTRLIEGMPASSEISLSDLSTAVSFRPSGPPSADLESFQMLSNALMNSQEVSFTYTKPGDGKGTERVIQPYHLGCIGGVWYLIGLDLARKAIRTFALARISGPKNLRRKFTRPKGFSLDAMLGDSFSAFETKNAQMVRILLDPISAALTGERRWHPSQKLVFRKDGSAELSLKVGLAPDLEAWILGWGSHAKVLAPLALRNRIKATAQMIAAQYR
jgi:predicted DNA-binding transcriptional regulator YafY